MKYAFVLILAATIIQTLDCLNIDEVNAMIAASINICQAQAPVTHDALRRFAWQRYEGDKTFQKYIFCMHLGVGFQNADGTLNPDVMQNVTAVVLGGSHEIDDLITKCVDSVTDTSPPRSATRFLRCPADELDKSRFKHLSHFYYHLNA